MKGAEKDNGSRDQRPLVNLGPEPRGSDQYFRYTENIQVAVRHQRRYDIPAVHRLGGARDPHSLWVDLAEAPAGARLGVSRDSSPGRVLAAGPGLERRRDADESLLCWRRLRDPVSPAVLRRSLG
ncbi:hypothetical protein NDU88_005407 [Pleurodeles waltl]|uniref:Uncharacterized protein n=1 Tax=Pleurodeles waltl TaxID=8319 RepID=A0AAV7RLD3_PLEWA|nr:hypothetical protein NDU88_005407 [Pleurodeles waltl]